MDVKTRTNDPGERHRRGQESGTSIRTVGVIGAGQMGNGIAHVCALAGYDVLLNDMTRERILAIAGEMGAKSVGGIGLHLRGEVTAATEQLDTEMKVREAKPSSKADRGVVVFDVAPRNLQG